MKTIITGMALFAMVSVACNAQKLKPSQVPEKVKTSFEKEFPAIKADWEKEGGQYEVNFKQSGKKQSLVIDTNGKIVEREIAIPVTDLPAKVAVYVQQQHNGATIKEAAKMVDANGVVTFEALVKGKDLVFDANGNYIKTVKD